MTYNKGIGRLSGSPVKDSFVLPSVPPSSALPSSFATPMLLASPIPGYPDAGWHVTLTDPIIWGTITLNGIIYNFPSATGAVGDVLTLTASDTVDWAPAVHTLSFGATGLTPSTPTSNNVVVGGTLNLSNGGTGLSTAGVAGTSLVSNGTSLSYGYPAQATNLSGGSLWTIPYQTTTNTTAFIPAGITGQVLSATTGAAPSWGSGTITIGTTPITLGSTVTALAGVSAVTLTQDPPTALDAATKQYVDSRTGSLNNLGSVVAATTANIALTGLQTIDGVTLVAGDSVLVKNQTNPAQDGLYIASAGGWSYAGYANTWADYVGALVFVAGGSQSGSSWTQTVGPGGTLGVTAMSWAQIGAAIAYTGGPGISVVGGTINNTGVLSWSGGTTGLTPSVATTGAITLGGTLQIANGGTGLTSLGTGVQAAFVNPVNAANGFAVLNVSGVIPIAQGGTGASTATTALNALLPTQSGQTGKYLQTDGTNATWSANPLGTVTSVDVSGGTTGLTTSGGPVTTSGVITLAGTLAITNGGTGLTTVGANGTVLTSNGTSAIWSALPPAMVYPASGIAVSTGSAWGSSITPGTGVATALGVNVGTAGSFVVNGGVLGTPTSGNFSTGTFTWPTFNQNTTGTAANVTGVVAIANGGTGQTTANAAFNALAPSQTSANTKVLTSDGTNTSFQPLVPSAVTGNIPVETATGSLSDSGKYFSDLVTTNNNVWSANQTQAAITAGLLNVPTLPPVTAATTANSTLTGLLTIDGVVTVAGNYILVKNQTTTSQNGVYRVVAGPWVRQAYVAGAYADVSTQVTYGDLAENGGIIFVLNGTVSRNVQYQMYFQNPSATLVAGTPVYVTAQNKNPQASQWNRFVDPQVGNDSTNNGSSAFPFATLTKALVGMSYPSTVTEASGGIDASAVTWTAGTPNCVVQAQNMAHDGGQSVMSGVQTFATGSTRVDFVNTTHSTGASSPFVFQSGAAMRNYFQGLTINTTSTDWLGLNANISNWITLDNIDFANFLATAINMPSFANAFTFNLQNQSRSVLRFTGAGAANTVINIQGCLERYVWVPPTFLGTINWSGAGYDGDIGSTAYPVGVIPDQPTLTTILAWTADSTYDGVYAINFAGPSAFAQGALFGKTTLLGTTYTYWVRTLDQSPATVSTKSGVVYSHTTTGWVLLASAATGAWAGIYDTSASQTAALANTAYAIALGAIDPNSSGVSLVAGTQIQVAAAGVYTFAPSMQVRNTDSNIHEFNLWFRLNGTDVPNSNSRFSITSSHGGTDGFSVPAVIFTAKLAANDYVELMWSVSNTAVEIYTVPAAAPAPAAPGVIVSVTSV